MKSVKRLRHRLGLPPVKPTIEAAFELAQATYLAISGQLAEACTAYAQLVAADPKVMPFLSRSLLLALSQLLS